MSKKVYYSIEVYDEEEHDSTSSEDHSAWAQCVKHD